MNLGVANKWLSYSRPELYLQLSAGFSIDDDEGYNFTTGSYVIKVIP